PMELVAENYPFSPLYLQTGAEKGNCDAYPLFSPLVPFTLPFYKICAKRTSLLRQNFVMPRLCYGSA
ncbi:MAG: hypothetical protein J6V55_00105, partial [Alistipes sp.]|nr:hypothetical protein [Alistipes sp.]